MPYTPIANGDVGAIVTSLEMTSRPPLRAMPASELRLERWNAPSPDKYRALYCRVGEPWLWFSRLEPDDAALAATIHHPQVRIWAVLDRRGIEVGILELDFAKLGNARSPFSGWFRSLRARATASG